MLIYVIKNKVNGKMYVGKTSFSIEKRWNVHVQHAFSVNYKKQVITQAIRKYGPGNFDMSLLEQCKNNEHANECEIKWIKQLNTRNSKIGYNLTDGGEGTPGRIVTEVTREKLRSRLVSVDTCRKISDAKRGKKLSDVARIANLATRPRGENHPNFGKSWGSHGKLSSSTKKKISIAHSGKKLTKEHRTNIGDGLKKTYQNKAGVNTGMCWYISGFVDDKLVCIYKNFDAVARQFNMHVKTLRKKIKNDELIDGIKFIKSSRCSINELNMKICSITKGL